MPTHIRAHTHARMQTENDTGAPRAFAPYHTQACPLRLPTAVRPPRVMPPYIRAHSHMRYTHTHTHTQAEYKTNAPRNFSLKGAPAPAADGGEDFADMPGLEGDTTGDVYAAAAATATAMMRNALANQTNGNTTAAASGNNKRKTKKKK